MEKPHEVNQVDLLYSELIAMELLCCHPYILHLHSNNGPGTRFNACSPLHLLTQKHEAGAAAGRGVKKIKEIKKQMHNKHEANSA